MGCCSSTRIYPTKVDMPLNKETKPNQTRLMWLGYLYYSSNYI